MQKYTINYTERIRMLISNVIEIVDETTLTWKNKKKLNLYELKQQDYTLGQKKKGGGDKLERLYSKAVFQRIIRILICWSNVPIHHFAVGGLVHSFR